MTVKKKSCLDYIHPSKQHVQLGLNKAPFEPHLQFPIICSAVQCGTVCFNTIYNCLHYRMQCNKKIKHCNRIKYTSQN